MLHLFRQRGLSNIVYGAVIVATILAFVITFRPNATSRTASLSERCAAKVRGRCIDPKDFVSAYRILMPSRSQSVSRKMNLKRIALDGLIERELLGDEAKRLDIGITDAEVTEQLYAGYVRVSIPAADPTVAQSVLSEMYQSYARAGLMPQEVAQAHFNERDTAIPVDFRDPKTKMFDMKVYERQVRNLSNRSTTEFREEQSRELLAAKMRDVVRDPVRISDTEAWQEYERQRSTATVAFIPVKESWAMRWAVEAKPAEVDAWAAEHKAEIDATLDERKSDDAPKAGHIRHILVKLPYGATDDEKAVALAKLSWAAARIRGGAPFSEVARDTSDDTSSAAKGGDVGDKTDGFVPPFREAANGLKAGETTDGAVETQFGYHYVERDDPSRAAEVDAQLKRSVARSMYAKAKATDEAQIVARRIGDAIRAGVDAAEAIKTATHAYVRETKAEGLKILAPSTASSAGGDAGAKTSSAKPAEGHFDASTDGDRPQVQTSTAFNRGGDPFAGLSPDGTTRVIAFAFSAKDRDVMAAPVRTADAFAVVQLKQRNEATAEDFAKDREAFEDELLRAKRDEALSLCVKRLRNQAKGDVKIDESYAQEARVDGGTSANEEEEDE
jgi:peptidyl-prolyl cis-trans isomerase D